MIKKQIVFFCATTPYVMIYKIAKELKNKGYETVLITISQKDKFDRKSFEDAFDKILCSNFQFFKPSIKTIPYILKRGLGFIHFLIEMKKLKPSVWFGIGRTNWQVMMAHKYYFKKYPFIFFEYDLNSHLYSSREEARKLGMPNFEIDSEKYCIENSDVLMHKGGKNELKVINGRIFDKVKLPKIIFHFYPYCSDEWNIPPNKEKLSKKDNSFHIVYVGGLFGEIGENTLVNLTVKKILDNKIHFHIYGKDQHLSNNESKNEITNRFKDLYKNPYFHIHEALDHKRIIKEISKYDFGIWIGEGFSNNNGPVFEYSTGNKLSTYLEAGIPFLYDNRLESINEILKKYKIDFSFEFSNIEQLLKKIKKIKKESITKRVLEARKDFSLQKNFYKLENLIKQLSSPHNQKNYKGNSK